MIEQHVWRTGVYWMVLLVSACERSSDERTARSAGGPPSSAGAAAAVAQSTGSPNSEIVLDVTGGPNAGHYTAQVTGGGCSGSNAPGSYWGNQYSIDTNNPREFSSLQLVVDSAHAPSGSKHFMMTISFGPQVGEGAQYEVNTRGHEHNGDGTIRVTDRGTSATVNFDARTKEGVGLKGTIECHRVTRFG